MSLTLVPPLQQHDRLQLTAEVLEELAGLDALHETCATGTTSPPVSWTTPARP
jgi:hypothetical protein